MAKPRPITYKPVWDDANLEKALDPYCHVCTSHKARTREGYILFNRQGFRRMHRYIYWLCTDEHPDVVLHKCGRHDCINPNHLEALTLEEANRRCPLVTQANPPKHYCRSYNSRLRAGALDRIRELLAQGYKPGEIARSMGLDYRTVSSIAAGETYRQAQDG